MAEEPGGECEGDIEKYQIYFINIINFNSRRRTIWSFLRIKVLREIVVQINKIK